MTTSVTKPDLIEEAAIAQPEESGCQPIWHLAVLCLFSLGIYPFFWFYKHWRYLKEKKDMPISPGFRTLFIVFTGYALFNIFKKLAIERGYTGKTPVGVFFFLYTVLVLISRFKEAPLILSFVGLFAFVFLVPVLNVMNFYYLKAQPLATVRKKLAWDELIFLLVIWGVLVVALFVS